MNKKYHSILGRSSVAEASSPGAGFALAVCAGRLQIESLCGLALAEGTPARARGVLVVNTDAGRLEGDDWGGAVIKRLPGGGVQACQSAAGGALEWQSLWSEDRASGVVSRRDRLRNAGPSSVRVRRALARLVLPPGAYEVYAQQSRWCNENQGAWLPLHAGELTFRNVPGRTTQGGTPYACIRPVGSRRGLVLHLLPRGNWVIRCAAVVTGDGAPFAVLELGLADENLDLTLAPGAVLDMPELLVQSLPDGEPHLAAPALHAYLLTRLSADAKPQAPVVYNTWFDQFERLDVPRLRRQLASAKAAGCEVFMIDAGWYGRGAADWSQQTGDWREKLDGAFHGRMRAFADTVRAAGLGFGLWIEAERAGTAAPVRLAHPDWFVMAGAQARIDLENPAAYAWLRGEMARLITGYKLAWIKLDFNFEMDADASGAELSGYAARWRQLLDELRAAHPRTFFEDCSSGALRGDLAALAHVDGHFLSDSVNSVDLLRISQGSWLRLLPGRIMRWAVLRSPGAVVPRYGFREADSPATVLVPGGAVWEPTASVDLDFALLAAMPGMLGFSGDLAGLPEAVAARLREHVVFFKRWRRFIAGAVGHLLTPPEPLASREGWVAFQLQEPCTTTSLLFVYRLGTAAPQTVVRLRGLLPGRRYGVRRALDAAARAVTLTGAELMRDGLPVSLPVCGGSRTQAAALFVIRA